jgi:hypothetical protein
MYAAKHGGKARYEVYAAEGNKVKGQVRPTAAGQTPENFG